MHTGSSRSASWRPRGTPAGGVLTSQLARLEGRLKALRAIHLACAIVARADLFVTGDASPLLVEPTALRPRADDGQPSRVQTGEEGGTGRAF